MHIAFCVLVFVNEVHCGAILPLDLKPRGLNEDFSMSITLWLYLSLFFLAVAIGPPVNFHFWELTRLLPVMWH